MSEIAAVWCDVKLKHTVHPSAHIHNEVVGLVKVAEAAEVVNVPLPYQAR